MERPKRVDELMDESSILFDYIEALEKDAARLDWLADPDNAIGNVQLPTECVSDNLHSLRDAIDAAMALAAEPKP